MNIKSIKGDPQLLSSEAFEIYAQCMFKATYEEYQQEISELSAKPENSVFACQHDGKFVGLITLEKTSATAAKIIGIAVKKEFQRGGIGKSMVRFAAQTLNVNLLTAETDDESVGFYSHTGFSTTPFIRHFPDADITRYECKLQVKQAQYPHSDEPPRSNKKLGGTIFLLVIGTLLITGNLLFVWKMRTWDFDSWGFFIIDSYTWWRSFSSFLFDNFFLHIPSIAGLWMITAAIKNLRPHRKE